mmetsp:Transcript_3769/g.7011  ORF Transcript_3769/g.7011 Transcript_3769/m.7011 type:complete len:213 (-) Transcript_3769:19-657(-)
MAPATSTASSNATSPISLVLPGFSGCGTRLMPTSITVAPGLTQSPRTISARPTAATRISARRHTSARSLVREWAMVTVQLSANKSCPIGLPKRLERPITTASLPERLSNSARSNMRQPSGVQLTSASPPVANSPALVTLSPSTSFAGSIRATVRRSSRWSGTGNWHRIPCTDGSAFNLSISAKRSSSEVSAGSLCSKDCMPTSTVALCLWLT